MPQPSQRALEIMRCRRQEQRRQARVRLPIAATVTSPHLRCNEEAALVRDINTLGAFFYCDSAPEVDQALTIHFCIEEGRERIKVSCEGIVMRVERFSIGAATGVALQFSHYELTRSSSLKIRRPAAEKMYEPFLKWTVDMVEQVFENNPELQNFNATEPWSLA